MRFRKISKRQALGVVFLLGMGVALVQAEIGGRVAAATADELRAATGGVSTIEIGPYSSGSDFDCRINAGTTEAYVYQDGDCFQFSSAGSPPPCSNVYHEHRIGDDPRVYYDTGTEELEFGNFHTDPGECSWW